MKASSIYPGGPERAAGVPLTDRAEVAEARRIFNPAELGVWPEEFGPEQLDSHEDYEATRDLERWGCDPFEEA